MIVEVTVVVDVARRWWGDRNASLLRRGGALRTTRATTVTVKARP